MTGLIYVDLLFHEQSQLRKHMVAEEKAKYDLHERQLRNMPLMSFTSISIAKTTLGVKS